MSKLTKHLLDFSSINWNHFITSYVYLHWIIVVFFFTWVTIFSRMFLLILPSELLLGLIVLHSMLSGKSFLWSLTVRNASTLENLSIFLFFRLKRFEEIISWNSWFILSIMLSFYLYINYIYTYYTLNYDYFKWSTLFLNLNNFYVKHDPFKCY